jgi:hypothetical protein
MDGKELAKGIGLGLFLSFIYLIVPADFLPLNFVDDAVVGAVLTLGIPIVKSLKGD